MSEALDQDVLAANDATGGGWDLGRMLSWAAQKVDSVLHKRLEWDDARAGHEYRLQQLRGFVARVRYIPSDEPERGPVRVVLERPSGNGYIERERVVGVEQMRLQLSIDAVSEAASRIANLGLSENDTLVAAMRQHVEGLAARLRDEAA